MSKLTAVAYYSGIPPGNNNPEKPMILDKFCKGVNAVGDIAIAQHKFEPLACDVALIQGFVHEHGKSAPHLTMRKLAIETQKRNNKKSLIVDSNLFLYSDKNNTKTYLRYSFDGVFPTTGFYFDKEVDTNRWKKISNDLRLDLKPYRSNGSHILICLQRNGGWSMGGLDVQKWLDNTILKIRTISPDRPIVIRKHPGDRKMKNIKIFQPNIKISQYDNILDDFKNCWATIVYNSSPSIASVIEGVPVFVTDPCPQNSQSYSVANLDLNKLESPNLYERQSWIEKLAMCHWNFQELESGEAWNYFKKFI